MFNVKKLFNFVKNLIKISLKIVVHIKSSSYERIIIQKFLKTPLPF